MPDLFAKIRIDGAVHALQLFYMNQHANSRTRAIVWYKCDAWIVELRRDTGWVADCLVRDVTPRGNRRMSKHDSARSNYLRRMNLECDACFHFHEPCLECCRPAVCDGRGGDLSCNYCKSDRP